MTLEEWALAYQVMFAGGETHLGWVDGEREFMDACAKDLGFEPEYQFNDPTHDKRFSTWEKLDKALSMIRRDKS